MNALAFGVASVAGRLRHQPRAADRGAGAAGGGRGDPGPSAGAGRGGIGDLGDRAELGGALGIAVLGVIGAAAYRGQVADAVPAQVPPRPQQPPATPSAAP